MTRKGEFIEYQAASGPETTRDDYKATRGENYKRTQPSVLEETI